MIPWIILLLVAGSFFYGIRPMIVMSGSMEPEIKTGSLCFVNTRAEYRKIREGDIITFNLAGAEITHRAVEQKPQGFITKGDANTVNDLGLVTKETFTGKAMFSVPYAGYLFFFIKNNPEYVIPAVFLGAGIFLCTTLFFRKEEKHEKHNL